MALADLRKQGKAAKNIPTIEKYLTTNEINQVVYTAQQSIGSIGDSFVNPNQSRKRIGQLFENLIKLMIKEIGFNGASRTISVPIPGSPDHNMSYELDIVFSKTGAIIPSESALIYPNEVVGSVKTTSKDRIDKIFLDKFLLTKLLGREVKMVAVFLHDVQRAQRANSIFGINSTFKTNHFPGYSLALNRLSGVYYVDPRPEMFSNPRLKGEIDSLQQFIAADIWELWDYPKGCDTHFPTAYPHNEISPTPMTMSKAMLMRQRGAGSWNKMVPRMTPKTMLNWRRATM